MTKDEIERTARTIVKRVADALDADDNIIITQVPRDILAAALRRAFNAGVDANGAAIDSLRPSHGGAGELIERDALIAAAAKVRALKLPE